MSRLKRGLFEDVQFASWAYDEDKILLNASHKPLLKNYSPNEEWALQVSCYKGFGRFLNFLKTVGANRIRHVKILEKL